MPPDDPSSDRTWPSRCAQVAYDLVIQVLTLATLLPAGLIDAAVGRSSVEHLRERLGLAPIRGLGSRPRMLIHAVSAGEMAAAGALVEAVLQECGSASFVLATGTSGGRAIAEKTRARIPAIDTVSYLPWDRYRAVHRWLERIGPDAVVVVETEIWPGLFRAARDLSIPLSIVSGRIERRSAAVYHRLRWFFRPVLECARWIGVQSERERTAYANAGAPFDRIEVAGNLKYDVREEDQTVEPWGAALAEVQGSPLIVAASSHSPEEEWLVAALRHLRGHFPTARLLLAPRQPDRAATLCRRVGGGGLTSVCWSEGHRARESWDVLVLDRVGPLAQACRWADIVVIGGSLVRRGGHSPIEPARHGRAIVIGPYHGNVEEAVFALQEAGGIRVLPAQPDVRTALQSALLELARDPERRDELGRRAAAFVRSQRGAARTCARSLLAEIPWAERHSRDGGAG